MFAERYRLQFISVADSDKDDASITTVDSDEEEDSDMYEMALEDVEIDQSSELYQTIVAAIIEESDNHEKTKNLFTNQEERKDTIQRKIKKVLTAMEVDGKIWELRKMKIT